MNIPFANVRSRIQPRSIRPLVLSGMLTLIAALHCPPIMANELVVPGKLNTTSTARDPIAWLSGGVGDEAQAEMLKAAAAYNVHLTFSERNGAYLADIPYTVALPDGREIYAGVSTGPLLYLKLSPGSYRIAAKLNGVWQSQLIHAGDSGASASIVFAATAELRSDK